MESATSSAEITRLLQAWGGGDAAALESLTPLVYAELRRMARRSMRRENPGHTLQPTALVNEAYLRLVDIAQVRWQDRAHFFAVAAQTMRRILVDAARARVAGKRGGGAVHVNLDESIDAMPDRGSQLVALDDALEALARLDPRKAKVIEMRFFGGLSVEETAEVLRISADTVMRDWKMARAWLMRELAGGTNRP
jgi:RNA polymerase sigma factor (TIGR02999 family)